MIRMRRAAPSLLVLGTLLVVLSTGTAAVAQVVNAAKADSGIAALVIDRLAYLAVANLTAWAIVLIGLWRWSGARISSANRTAIADHNADSGAHEAAARHNHGPIEVAMAALDKEFAVALSEIRAIRRAVEPLGEIDARLRSLEEDHAAFHGRRDPGASPHRCRVTDPEGEDHAGERGRG